MHESYTYRILILGDAMLDAYVHCDYLRNSPEANVPVLNHISEEYRLGGAANVAANIKSLGSEAYLIGLAGQDDEGREMFKLLKNRGIRAKFFSEAHRPTILKKRFVDRDYRQFFRLDRELTEYINDALAQEIFSFLKEILSDGKWDAIILQDYNKGLLSSKLITDVLELAKQYRVKVFADPKHKNFDLLARADFFKPNLNECISYLEASKDIQVQELVDRIEKKLDCSNMIVTLGDRGLYYRSGEKFGYLSAYQIDNPDVSGAGDAVIAATCIAMLEGMTIEETASFANRAGAASCDKPGIHSVTRAEIAQFGLENQGKTG